MISALVSLIVLAVLIYCVELIVGWLALPAPLARVIQVLLGLIVLLYVLRQLGVFVAF